MRAHSARAGTDTRKMIVPRRAGPLDVRCFGYERFTAKDDHIVVLFKE
jgi:hypothetical protein